MDVRRVLIGERSKEQVAHTSIDLHRKCRRDCEIHHKTTKNNNNNKNFRRDGGGWDWCGVESIIQLKVFERMEMHGKL